MIVVSACAGLANQMFQYAFYLALKEKYPHALWDQSNFVPRSSMTCETVRIQDVFPNVNPDIMPPGHFRMAYWKRRWSMVKKISGFFTGNWYLLERDFLFHPDEFGRARRNCIYLGAWQCEKYFLPIADKIRHAFTFPELESDRNISMARQMQAENSVAIHVRKGNDYVNEKLFKGTCPAEYYKKAIEYVRSKVDNPVFYLFTDNPAWVRENLPGLDFTLVDWNPVKGRQNYVDMQLMSCARHNIISNSSYSWWGAWLNPNPSKIVVAPEPWFNPEMPHYNPNQIVPESWIKI